MITFNVSGTQVAIPSKWEDVSFKHYCEILKTPRTTVQLLSMFSGIDCEILNKATIFGLDDVLTAISFLNKVPVVPEEVTKIGPYSLISRQNIKFECLALFEDMKAEAMKADPKNISDFTERYGVYVAMYLQNLRDGEYSLTKARAMKDEVDSLPALQVISLGSFFFVKLGILLSGIDPSSRPTTQSRKKSTRDMTSSKKRSVSTGRSRKRR